MQKHKRISKSLIAGILTVTVALLFLGSCSKDDSSVEAETKSAEDKTVFIGQVNPPITFNPVNCPSVASQYDQKPILDSLLGMVEPLKFEPLLADTFELKDPTTLLIKINDKANWTDGQPVSSEDVAFTINRIANPKIDSAISGYLKYFPGLGSNGKLPEGETELSAITIVDNKTLEIKLVKSIDVNIIREQIGVNMRIIPKHVLKDIPAEDFNKAPYFASPTVTSGAYKFVKYEKDQYVEYVANHDYFRGAPKIEHMFITLVPATNMAAKLETGEIHFNTGTGIGLIPSTDFETVMGLSNIRTKTEPNTSVQMILFNVSRIKDKRVRQALAYAMDRESILKNILKGSGEIVDPPLTSMNPYLDKSIPPYPHNVDKAKELLAEAGWDPERELEFVVPIGNKDREQAANIVAQNFAEAGIKVKMNKFDFPTVLKKAVGHDFDLVFIGNNFLLDPDGISSLYQSSSPYDMSFYKNDEVDRLFDEGRNEPDPSKRHQIYSRIQQIIYDELPLITIYSYHELLGVSDQLIKGEPRFYGTFYDVNEWDLK
ncbi:MAG: ABC transporter substrate-binding protein [Spirochaetales bacterium]|nr:ABC transporter substrate-binding protein [Spirochaetales bacterium]